MFQLGFANFSAGPENRSKIIFKENLFLNSGRPATHCPVVGLFTDVWVAPSIPAVRSVRHLRCKRREIKKQQEKECKECHDTFMKMRLSEERSMKVMRCK